MALIYQLLDKDVDIKKSHLNSIAHTKHSAFYWKLDFWSLFSSFSPDSNKPNFNMIINFCGLLLSNQTDLKLLPAIM